MFKTNKALRKQVKTLQNMLQGYESTIDELDEQLIAAHEELEKLRTESMNHCFKECTKR